MTSPYQSNASTELQIVETAKSLLRLYFIRATFSLIWVTLVILFAKTSLSIGSVLLIIYPAWDVIGTLIDIRSNHNSTSKTPQYINVAISAITTVAVGLALQQGVPMTLIVFGAFYCLLAAFRLSKTVNRAPLAA